MNKNENLNLSTLIDAIDTLQIDLNRLRELVQPEINTFDPKDSLNKSSDGKFTARGIEICYRMFDAGKTRYAVADAMDISFGAATHRLVAWKKEGGSNRVRQPL